MIDSVWKAVLVSGLLLLPGRAPGADGPVTEGEGAAPPRTAVLFFVAFRSRDPLPAAPTEVRTTGGRILEECLRTHGHDAPPGSDIEPFLQSWRVRSDGSFPPEFLREVRTRLEVDALLVARLTVYTDRVVLEARALRSETGRIAWAGVAEEPRKTAAGEGETEAAWEDPIRKAAERIADGFASAPATGGAELIVLPVVSVGAEEGQVDLATTCLLVSLLRDGLWTPIDPALPNRVLQNAGIGPGVLGSEGRRALRESFGEKPILVPRLVSYASTDEAAPIMDEEEAAAAPNRSLLAPLYLTLAFVDIEDGSLLFGDGLYIPPEDATGLFGVARNPRLEERLLAATDRLVSGFPVHIGGQ
jgi:hypothetical protein